MNNKILSLLGFASKAGKLSFGFDKASQMLKSKKSCLIIIASDVSIKSAKEIIFFAKKANTQCISLENITISELSGAVGKQCGILSINDKGFAEACLNAQLKGGDLDDQ